MSMTSAAMTGTAATVMMTASSAAAPSTAAAAAGFYPSGSYALSDKFIGLIS